MGSITGSRSSKFNGSRITASKSNASSELEFNLKGSFEEEDIDSPKGSDVSFPKLFRLIIMEEELLKGGKLEPISRSETDILFEDKKLKFEFISPANNVNFKYRYINMNYLDN